MLKKLLSNLSYLLIAMLLGFGIYYYLLNPQLQNNTPANLSSAPFFSAALPNDQGVNQALSQYQGKIIVLNFWATWCPPCREEMPELSRIQDDFKAKNVVVLGIAIDEQALVQKFNESTPVSYPLLVSEDEGMALSNTLGNTKGVLPYTLVIDANGLIIKTYFGRISYDMIASALKALQ